MALRKRYKPESSFSMASMTDIVFLLLIFFMITSTLVAPNAIKLLLPQSNSRTMAKQTSTVYINENSQYLMDVNQSGEAALVNDTIMYQVLRKELAVTESGSVVLRAEKSVPVQTIVNVFDVVDKINREQNATHKVILATQPKK